MRAFVSVLIATACLATSPSFGQTSTVSPGATPGLAPTGTIGSTRTGDYPDKTASTTAIGQTKPPGQAVGDGLGTRPDLEDKSRDLTRRIQRDICTGCE